MTTVTRVLARTKWTHTVHSRTWRQGLPFLYTIATRRGTQLDSEVNAYRKPTHTDLDFNSHHPMYHKRSVVSTLLRRALNMPSTQVGKHEETKPFKDALRDNNYSHPASIAAKDRCRNSQLIYHTMDSLWYPTPPCRTLQKGLVESSGNKNQSRLQTI